MGSTETQKALAAAIRQAQRETLNKRAQDEATAQAHDRVKDLQAQLLREIQEETTAKLADPDQAARKPKPEPAYGTA